MEQKIHPQCISIAYDRLYLDGVLFPEGQQPIDSGSVIIDTAAHGITFLEEVFSAISYGSPFSPSIFTQDNDFTRSIWSLYQLHAQKWALPSVLVRIDDAITSGPLVYCGSSKKRLLVYETYRPNDRPAVALDTDIEALQQLLFEPEDGISYFFLSSAGSLNYGHFLVDDLPRLKALSFLSDALNSRTIVILMMHGGTDINRIRQEAVEVFCPTNVRVRFLDPRRAYRFRELYYVSPVSLHPVQKNPQALEYVVNTALAAANGNDESDISPDQNLFVVRSDDVGRQLINKASIARFLDGHGFKMVETGTRGLLEQVRMFSRSKITIGQMGAGMTNTLFSRTGTTAVYLAPSQWIEPFYWDLAVACGQHYRVIYGDRQHMNSSAHLDNFSIAEHDVQEALENLA